MTCLTKDNRQLNSRMEKVDLNTDQYVQVRELSSSETISITRWQKENAEDHLGFACRVVSHCAVDDDGEQIFEDHDQAAEIPFAALQKIMKKAMELSGIGDEEDEGDAAKKN